MNNPSLLAQEDRLAFYYFKTYAADLPRFCAYATKVASRYAPLRGLLGLLERMSGLRETTAFSMR